MRVFDTIAFNVKAVKFQDTKEYLDELLHTCGLSYNETALYANYISDNAFEKLKKSFSSLVPYVTGCDGIRHMLGFLTDETEQEALAALVKKIPRGVPITDIGVMLDGINWNGERKLPADRRSMNQPPYHTFYGCYSDHIEWYKVSMFGTKRNPVVLTVERFTDGDSLLPLPESVTRLCDMLGKPEYRSRKCVFDPADEAIWDERENALKKHIMRDRYDDRFDGFIKGGTLPEQLDRLPQELQPPAGFSPKSVFVKAAKPFGFRFSSFRQGEYVFFKINRNGHRFDMTMVIPPLTSYVFSRVWVSGWNVNMPLEGTPQVTVYDEQTLAAYAEKAFAAANETVERYEGRIVSDFGETPRWFWENP